MSCIHTTEGDHANAKTLAKFALVAGCCQPDAAGRGRRRSAAGAAFGTGAVDRRLSEGRPSAPMILISDELKKLGVDLKLVESFATADARTALLAGSLVSHPSGRRILPFRSRKFD